MARDYYNDNDPGAAAWLRELIRAGEIPDGDVDERSILDVRPADLAGYRRVHFFAGIGGWAEALRLADWPDDIPVWTGSPPCQPFSVAGRGLAADDPRHLAPHFVDLVRACRPGMLFGEQVASAAVFGKAANKEVHPLWKRQRNLELLKDSIERELEKRLSGLSKRTSERTPQGSPGRRPSQGGQDGVVSQIKSGKAGSGLRPHGSFRGRKTGTGEVRSDGHPIFDGIEEGMGLTFNGPSDTGQWLHPEECPDGSFFGQHGLLRLGRGRSQVCSTLDLEDAHRNLERVIAQGCRELEEADCWTWIDSLHADLERAHYSLGAVDLPSAGVGAPHIRQRTFFGAVSQEWLADSHGWERNRFADGKGCKPNGAQTGRKQGDGQLATGSELCRLVHGQRAGLEGHGRHGDGGHEPGRFDADQAGSAGTAGSTGGLADLHRDGCQPGREIRSVRGEHDAEHGGAAGGMGFDRRPGPTNGFWADADWLHCRDAKWRPVEPGSFEVADGISVIMGQSRDQCGPWHEVETEEGPLIVFCPLSKGEIGRVMRLRGYGNAINPHAAALFIRSFMETVDAVQ